MFIKCNNLYNTQGFFLLFHCCPTLRTFEAQAFNLSIIGAFLRMASTSVRVISQSKSVSTRVHMYFNSPLPVAEILKLSIFASAFTAVIISVQLTLPLLLISSIFKISSISGEASMTPVPTGTGAAATSAGTAPSALYLA